VFVKDQRIAWLEGLAEGVQRPAGIFVAGRCVFSGLGKSLLKFIARKLSAAELFTEAAGSRSGGLSSLL
jgi:hypothetical protein